jgi:hypothetical protein
MYHQLEQDFNERVQQQETMRKKTKRESGDVLESGDVFEDLNESGDAFEDLNNPNYNGQEYGSEEGGYNLIGSVGTMAKKAVSAVGSGLSSGLSYSVNLLGG